MFTISPWSVFSVYSSALFNGRSSQMRSGVSGTLEIRYSIWMSAISREFDVCFAMHSRTDPHRQYFTPADRDLICLLLWECRLWIAGRFLSATAPFNLSRNICQWLKSKSESLVVVLRSFFLFSRDAMTNFFAFNPASFHIRYMYYRLLGI